MTDTDALDAIDLTAVRQDPAWRRKELGTRAELPADPDSKRDVTVYATTDSVDADDEVVLPAGVDMTRFLQNPVLLLSHSNGTPGTYGLPIGRVVDPVRKKHGILAGLQFSRNTPMGQLVKALYDERMMNAVSIGFRSLGASLMTREEAESRPDWKAAFERTNGRILVHRRWEWLELSCCGVGSNPDARQVVQKFIKTTGLDPASIPGFSFSEARTMPEVTAPAAQQGGETVKAIKNTARFDVVRKSADTSANGIAAVDVTPADARVMIGLWLPPETAKGLAIAGGDAPEDLHLTLCYLGRAIEVGTNAIDRVKRMCQDLASYSPPLMGKVAGVGRFSASNTSDGKDVIYASADIPDLAEFRQRIAYNLQDMAVVYSKAHGFTPHITLAYVDPTSPSPIERIEPQPLMFDRFCLVVDGVRTDFPFSVNGFGYGGPVMAWRAASDAITKCYGTGMKSLSVGDHVEHKSGTCGRLKAIHADGMYPRHSGDHEAGLELATEDEPVGIVAEHDDEHGESGVDRAYKMKHLKAMDADGDGDMDGGDEEPTEKTVASAQATGGGTAKGLTEGSGTSGGYTVAPEPEPVGFDNETDEDDETSEGAGFQKDDHVLVRAPHFRGKGVVRSIHKAGIVRDSVNDLIASPDEPAARVQVHKGMGDGHVPSDLHVAAHLKHLKKLDKPLELPSKVKGTAAPARPATSTPRKSPQVPIAIDPLPPLVALSDDQFQAEALKRIADLPNQIREHIDRRLGCIN